MGFLLLRLYLTVIFLKAKAQLTSLSFDLRELFRSRHARPLCKGSGAGLSSSTQQYLDGSETLFSKQGTKVQALSLGTN